MVKKENKDESRKIRCGRLKNYLQKEPKERAGRVVPPGEDNPIDHRENF